jgi:RHS repeat-associated protein
LLGVCTLHAFFPKPNPLSLDVGTTGVVEVHGSNASAKVSLQSIFISPGGGGIAGGVTHDLTGTRNGTGHVTVNFSALAPGTYSVTFIGTNNGQNVSGFTTITVGAVPGTSAQNLQFAIAGDPINTRSGEYFGFEAVDLNLGGPMPLTFSRYVASGLSTDNVVQAALGANRSHNFAARTFADGTTVRRVILPTGRMLRFDKVGAKWVFKSPQDVPFQLVESSGDFVLGHPQTKQLWTFNANGRLTKIEDGKGNAHTLTYTSGKLSSVSDGLGRVINITQPGATITGITGVTGAETRAVTFAYTSGVLTAATDYGTHTTNYAHDTGRLTGITRPMGNTLFSQVYTGGKVTSQTERGTDTSTLSYGANSTTFTNPVGDTLVDNYDAKGNLTSHVDEAGKAITMGYDAAGRRCTVTDRNGRVVTTLSHAASGLPASITNAEGRSTLFTYKARTLSSIVFHDLVKITRPDGSARSFAYDAKGNVTQITDETGNAWKYTYNNRGQLLTATNPLGGVTTYTYDAAGNLSTSTPQDEGTTNFAYDARHRLTQITRPGGATVIIAYDVKDRVTSTTDERGKVFTYTYDSNDRLTSVADPDTNTTAFAHDVLDRVTSVTDTQTNVASVTFNSRRLPATRTDRNGNTVTTNYDARQRPIEIVDAGGQTWTLGYDEEGRLISAQNPADAPSRRRLNLLGYPVEFSDPLGNTSIVTRDAMQRVTQFFDPVGRLTSYTYDNRGRLISAAEQGAGTAKYTRDALGMITKLTDPNGGAWSFACTKAGRVQKATDPLGKSTDYTYDNRGRLATVAHPDGTTSTLGYDAASNVTSAAHSAGPNLAFAYDNLGRLTSADGVTFVYNALGRLVNCEQNGQNFSATYDAGGRLTTVSYLGAAFTVSYTYDSRNRLTAVSDSKGTSIAFAYDNAGRPTGQTRTPGVDATYTYDGAGRLTRIQDGPVDLNYTLNAAGEIASVDYTAPSLPGVPAEARVFTFGKAGEITTAGYTYDARGRLTAAPGGRTFQWDGASRLVNATGVTLIYNGLGDIVTRTESSNTTRFYHHYALRLAPIVYEDAPSGSDRAYVWTPGGRLLYSVDIATGDPTFYHFDRTGSTLALTDKNSATTDGYAYGPYGESLGRFGTSTQPFTYIGAYGVRAEGALYHMRARYYDPASARFLARDPLQPRLADVKSLNPYAYANNNPLRYVDPRGAESQDMEEDSDEEGSDEEGDSDLDESMEANLGSYGKTGYPIAEVQRPLLAIRGLLEIPHSTGVSLSIRNQSLPHSMQLGLGGKNTITGAPGAGHSNANSFKTADAPRPTDRVFFSYSVGDFNTRPGYAGSPSFNSPAAQPVAQSPAGTIASPVPPFDYDEFHEDYLKRRNRVAGWVREPAPAPESSGPGLLTRLYNFFFGVEKTPSLRELSDQRNLAIEESLR